MRRRRVGALQCSIPLKVIAIISANVVLLIAILMFFIRLDVMLYEPEYHNEWMFSESWGFRQALTQAFELTMIANGIDSYALPEADVETLHEDKQQVIPGYQPVSARSELDAKVILGRYYSNYLYTLSVDGERHSNDPWSFDRDGALLARTEDQIDGHYQYRYIYNGHSAALSESMNRSSPGPLKTDQLFLAPARLDSTVILWFSVNDVPANELNVFYKAHQRYRAIRNLMPMTMPSLMISLIAAFLLMFYGASSSGYKRRPNGDLPDIGDITLSWLDAVPNDIFCLLFILPVGFLVSHNRDLMHFTMLDPRAATFLTADTVQLITVLITVLTLLSIFFFSEVRRGRAGVIWDSTWLAFLFSKVGVLWKHRGQIRLAVLMGLGILATILTGIWLKSWLIGSVTASVLLLILFGYAYLQSRDLARLKEQSGRMAQGDFDARQREPFSNQVFHELSEDLSAVSLVAARSIRDQIKSEHLKAELISNVSHDLKTPLTSIINYTDLLKRPGLSEAERADYIGIIEQRARQLKTLTEDLMEASKVTSGNVAVKPDALVLMELLRQAAAEYEAPFEAVGLHLTLRAIGGSAERTIYSDGQLIWRVLQNLLDNCRKYALSGSRVYLTLSEQPSGLCLTLRNISAHPIREPGQHLLERFVRGDASRHTEGSGLGLSIAHSLITLLGGSFALEAVDDLFTVRVVLPFAYEPAGHPAETADLTPG